MSTSTISMAEGNLAEAAVPFDLDAWAIEYKLSRKTTGALRKDECDQVDSLKLLTSSDIKGKLAHNSYDDSFFFKLTNLHYVRYRELSPKKRYLNNIFLKAHLGHNVQHF